ncbi:IS3 family transposase [Streptomyces sp. NPDC051286]|uniref:IS3 family transposase n=1 Tax=Streptomyces sp. NPDC051286 TaxID=3365647 RepID=UPI0037AB5507
MPRITLDLWEEGWQVSQNTVADVMAELGLQGRRPPRRRRSLTRQGKRKASPDLVRRGFDAIAPDVLWWGDMTEIDTGEGKLYLASVHDAFSRRALGSPSAVPCSSSQSSSSRARRSRDRIWCCVVARSGRCRWTRRMRWSRYQ